jgi:hypothetical protein
MNLQTQISLKKETRNPIDYNSKILLLGSCFSENIGDTLSYFKFQSAQNPFGILFHPKAIEGLISNAIYEKEYLSNDLIFQNERWHCFDAHSSLSASNKSELLENLNRGIQTTKNYLKEASHIMITLGTSWVYRYIETNSYVANCHKIPQKQFSKELLSVASISESLEAIVSLIKSINSAATVVFTVSPVRHLKDGFVENQRSKSHLIAGIHSVLKQPNVAYFPSYEIMMDELRDYRFYAEDMLHPNKTAINYIWNRFSKVWISNRAEKTMQEVDRIQKGLQHRSFNPESEQHQQFLQNLEDRINILQKKHPSMVF